jgi:hypothetical protein
VLVAVAILLFLLAAGGGFALARTVGGQSLLPPAAEPASTPNGPTRVPPPTLVHQTGNGSALNNDGGQYGLDVPEGWQRFVAPHNTKFGLSLAVQYVSPDGRRSLRLERLAKYFDQFDSYEDYLGWLRGSYQGSELELFAPSKSADGKSATVTYRLAEGGAAVKGDGSGGTRVTFVKLVQAGLSLWILSVTVPAEQESAGQVDVFDRVAPTLQVSD